MDKDAKKAEMTTLTTSFFIFIKKERMRKMIRDVDSKDSLHIIWKKLTLEEKTELQEQYDDKLKRLENRKGKQ